MAELAAIVHFLGKDGANGEIVIRSENEALVRKCFTLLRKTFNMNKDCACDEALIVKSGSAFCMTITKEMDIDKVKEAASSVTLTQKSCCKRAYLRGAFLAIGSISNPEKSYHLEYVCSGNDDAECLEELLHNFDIEAKSFVRKNSVVVYIKDGTQIAQALNVMEAHVALMELENTRILKEVRNSVNRVVNCDSANAKKTVSAAQKQIDEIEFLMGTKEYMDLPESVRQLAELRTQNPEATLAELGELLNPPISKSGVNHRMRKLSEMAARAKGGEL